MHSRVGVMQVAYGIGVLPLIKCLKAAYTDVTRPWYEADADALGTFNNIGLYFNSLKRFGPGCGYYPKHPKSFIIVHLYNIAARKYFGHWSSPVLRNGNRMASFMHSRVGVMQVAYGIGVLPLIKCLKAAYTDVTRPWYEADADALGTFNNIGLYFNSLKRFGPGCGYYPKHPKSFIIVHLYNIAARKYFGLCHGFQVCMGTRYMGGFIGDDKSKRDWLNYQMSKWEKKIVRSLKRWGNIPRRVTPRWFVGSNRI